MSQPPAAAQPPVDELDEDTVTVPGQLFALVSFVAPEGTRQRNDRFGMKIRGCFGTKDEAQRHVRRLQQTDRVMDIYLVDMYKWLLIPPDPTAIEDAEYQEQFLNDLIRGYRENQELAKLKFGDRKDAIQRDGLDSHLLEHERLPAPDEHAAMFGTDDPLTARRRAADADAAGPSGST